MLRIFKIIKLVQKVGERTRDESNNKNANIVNTLTVKLAVNVTMLREGYRYNN